MLNLRFNIKFDNTSDELAKLAQGGQDLSFLYAFDVTLPKTNIESAAQGDNNLQFRDESQSLQFKRNGIVPEISRFQECNEKFLRTVNDFAHTNAQFLGIIMGDQYEKVAAELEKDPVYMTLIEDVIDYINNTIKPLLVECNQIYLKSNGDDANDIAESIEQYMQLVDLARIKIDYLTRTIKTIEQLIEGFRV
ncbi:MAG: hypothetical protein COZ46_03865 [Verrucomicrobia bacterium CG_4_10_14_3_um_filter_43_23]|nr:MAG: hypothetical protein AUJ82_03010 [Verrucomicrobia bacterium CG1_02_43_26]PIP59376.1 MAG: hypothetical protein COX01_03725 [Verrucomicrobia bacterium CG22_combo_CG10-13_8_21_14_all_43_17]PIX58502.1 MAG: hypothetical protein COZ46_03865 [Verrucomicrobia bacterium CG_4_10_14_3_um_filter_43_23]PIY62251.1 MAG: hypothetical protein COY94_02760 [Verrucomicrobia bacterium CG_4_10_14_0_8_um_filter_43_34]PJA44285.1 MAG: hypothetical protein CO175_03520 [Verrucomicrobia bacterium CG_4_9_14_3_um_fi